jgi:hypothetical protein
LPSSQLIYLLALTLDFSLVLVYLLLLLVLRLFVSLKLITNESSCTKPERSANCGAGRRMTNSGTDQASRRRAAQRSDSGSLFPRR